MPSPSRYPLLLLVLLSLAVLASSNPVLLSIRQQATAGNNTNTDGGSNGGAASADAAAAAAGTSIDTGAGGSRGSPTTTQGFAQLLSGLFFGALLNLFFGGIFLSSAWTYFERYGRRGSDRLVLQLAVGALLFLSLLQDAVLVHRIYTIHVLNFGNFAYPLLTIGWEVATNYVATSLMATIVQIFFAQRVWVAFGRSLFVSIPSAILITYTFFGGIASAVLVLQSGSAANVKGSSLRSFQPDSSAWQWSVVFATWLVSSTVLDIALCAGLMAQLVRMKTETFFHTQYAIARLGLLSLETCFLTTSFSLVSMILMLAQPEQFYYSIPFSALGQVSALSFIATLMSRSSIARELTVAQGVTGPHSRDIDDLSKSVEAPVTVAKPLIKRLMKKERRRQHGQVSIQMSTEVHQITSKLRDEELPACLEEKAPTQWTQDRWGGSDTTLEERISNTTDSSPAPPPLTHEPSTDSRSVASAAPFSDATPAITSILQPPSDISAPAPIGDYGRTPRGRLVKLSTRTNAPM